MAASQSVKKPDMALCLAIALSVAAAMPLLVGPGFVNTRAGGDSLFLVQRVQQLSENLRVGVFPVRWVPDAAYGLGYPFFNFYAAMPYYIASLLQLAGAGVLWGIKLTQTLGFVLAGLGMYLLAYRVTPRKSAALLASAVYTFAPFHLINVYVRGDALSEFYAYALYPWIIYAVLRLRQRADPLNVALLAASYACLVLSHNISAMIFSPLLGFWLLVETLARREARVRWLLSSGGAIALGLLLSAWFWAPALREQGLVQLYEQTTGYLHYAGHFRGADLVQLRWIHDYAITATETPWSAGLIQALVGLAGLVALGASAVRRRAVHTSQAIAAVSLLGYSFLITPGSRWLWDHLPLLPYTQFPWRLLAVQAFATALIATALPGLFPLRWGWAVTLGFALLAAVGGMAGLRLDRLPIREADLCADRLMLYETYSGNIGTTIRHEYLPDLMIPRPYLSAVQLMGGNKPPPLALEGTLDAAQLLERGPERELWQVEISSPALLAFHTIFFPGWEAIVDDTPQGVEPLAGLGLAGVRLQPGTHRVELRFSQTPVRRYAEWASAVGLVIWVLLVVYQLRLSRAGVIGLVAMVAVLACAWCGVRYGVFSRGASGHRVTAVGPAVMDFARAPYLHEEPSGVCWDGACLKGYTLSDTQLTAGDTLRVVLEWRDTLPSYCAHLELTVANAHLFEPSPRWAWAVAAIEEAHTVMDVDLPEDLPPGLYVLRLSVTHEGTELPPRTGAGQLMGEIAFQPVQILSTRRSLGEEPALGQYGAEQTPPVISLVEVGAASRGERELVVSLTWRSERQAPLNYALSVRIKGANDEVLTARDLPPLLGMYPTSLWRPGELITDRVILSLPNGELGAGDRALEVVLYDLATLQAAGTTLIHDLVVDPPEAG